MRVLLLELLEPAVMSCRLTSNCCWRSRCSDQSHSSLTHLPLQRYQKLVGCFFVSLMVLAPQTASAFLVIQPESLLLWEVEDFVLWSAHA